MSVCPYGPASNGCLENRGSSMTALNVPERLTHVVIILIVWNTTWKVALDQNWDSPCTTLTSNTLFITIPSRPHYAKVPNCFDGSPCHVSTIKTSLCQGSKLLWWFSMPCFNHQDLTMPRFLTALMVLHAMFQPSRPHYAKVPNCFDGSPCHVSTIKTSLCQGS